MLSEFRVQFRLSLKEMPYTTGIVPRAVTYLKYSYSKRNDQALIAKIFNWRLAWAWVENIHLEIRKSQVDGMGLFSVNGVDAYTVLGKYTGELLSKESTKSCRYACDFSENRLLSARDKGNEFRYINDGGVDANVSFIKCYKCVYVLTKQKIDAGCELLADYGLPYWVEQNLVQ